MATSDSDIDGMSVSDFAPSNPNSLNTEGEPVIQPIISFCVEVERLAKELWDGKITKQTFNRKTNEALKKWKEEAKEDVKVEDDIEFLYAMMGEAKISK